MDQAGDPHGAAAGCHTQAVATGTERGDEEVMRDEHRREAERYLREANREPDRLRHSMNEHPGTAGMLKDRTAELLMKAQVHATLALSASTAVIGAPTDWTEVGK